MPGHEIKEPRNQVVPYGSSISLSGCGLDKARGEIGDSQPCVSHRRIRHLHVAIVHGVVNVSNVGILNFALANRGVDTAVSFLVLLPLHLLLSLSTPVDSAWRRSRGDTAGAALCLTVRAASVVASHPCVCPKDGMHTGGIWVTSVFPLPWCCTPSL